MKEGYERRGKWDFQLYSENLVCLAIVHELNALMMFFVVRIRLLVFSACIYIYAILEPVYGFMDLFLQTICLFILFTWYML